jgi:hypothetical protein
VPLEVELAIEKLKSHKSPGIDQFPAELIKAGGRKIAIRSINLLLFGEMRNCLRNGVSRSLYRSTCIRKAINQIVAIIRAYHFENFIQNLSNILLLKLTSYAEEIIGDHQC